MGTKVKHSDKPISVEKSSGSAKTPHTLMRREAIKRIAFLAAGGLTGAVLASSCTKPEDPYSSYASYASYNSYNSYNSYKSYSSYTSYSSYNNYSNYSSYSRYSAYNNYYSNYYNYYVASW